MQKYTGDFRLISLMCSAFLLNHLCHGKPARYFKLTKSNNVRQTLYKDNDDAVVTFSSQPCNLQSTRLIRKDYVDGFENAIHVCLKGFRIKIHCQDQLYLDVNDMKCKDVSRRIQNNKLNKKSFIKLLCSKEFDLFSTSVCKDLQNCEGSEFNNANSLRNCIDDILNFEDRPSAKNIDSIEQIRVEKPARKINVDNTEILDVLNTVDERELQFDDETKKKTNEERPQSRNKRQIKFFLPRRRHKQKVPYSYYYSYDDFLRAK